MLYIIVHFLLNVYFNELLLAIYFICILDYGNNVRQKQIPVIFLFKFKMGHKQWRQLTTSTTHLAQELLTNIQCSSGSRSFAKEKKALKMRSRVAGHQKLIMTSLRAIIVADPLTATREVAEELNVNHSMVVQHLQQTGKVKKLDKWVPHELTTNQKRKFILKCCLLLFYITAANHFSIGL